MGEFTASRSSSYYSTMALPGFSHAQLKHHLTAQDIQAQIDVNVYYKHVFWQVCLI